MRRTVVAATLVILALNSGACRKECAGAASCAPRPITVSIGAKAFVVEVAATPAARSQGLMNRPEVEAGRGMLFLFPNPTRAGFWMKNTLVALDIAFIAEGRVLEVRKMTPCRVDSCPLTRPSGFYTSALETAAGALDGVEPGAQVAVTGDVPAAS